MQVVDFVANLFNAEHFCDDILKFVSVLKRNVTKIWDRNRSKNKIPQLYSNYHVHRVITLVVLVFQGKVFVLPDFHRFIK